jgi:hypothetical protein
VTTVLLDPVAMDATAGAVGEHAREAESTVADLERACSAVVPASIAGWLAQELHDIAVHVRTVALLYTVAALDTAFRAQHIQADQSLVAAVPALGGPPSGFTAAASPIVGGFVLGEVSPTPTYPSTAGGTGFVLGEVTSAPAIPSTGWGSGLLLGASGPNTPIGGYTPAGGGGGALVDIPGYHSTNRKLLSEDGRTHVAGNIYEGSGRTGTFHQVLPDPGHDG